MHLSVLILTYNEAANIERCVEALRSAEQAECHLDLVILDSGSTDETTRIAERLGVPVYTRAFDTFASQRNWGMASIPWQSDWVLHLDADERVTVSLMAEIATVLQEPSFDAYLISSKLMFMDRWIKRSSMFPRYQARLLKRGTVVFSQQGHGQHVDPLRYRLGILQESYEHYNFSKGISDWVEKHNRYSTDEARASLSPSDLQSGGEPASEAAKLAARQRRLKEIGKRLPFRPFFRFAYLYIWRLGFLDGIAGFHYCVLMGVYQYLIDLKAKELRHSRVRVQSYSQSGLGDAIAKGDGVITS